VPTTEQDLRLAEYAEGVFESWRTERRVRPPILMTVDKDDALYKLLTGRKGTDEESKRSLVSTLFDLARWAVFDVNEDGEEVLRLVGYALDPETAELVLSPSWEINGFETDEELKQYITYIHADGIPLLAETPELQARADALLREAMTVGFDVKTEDEENVKRMRFTPGGEDVDFDDAFSVARLAHLTMPIPGAARLAVGALQDELVARSEAGRLLAALRLANAQLARALEADVANEAELQRVLTSHPVLLGPEYSRVSPQHALGREYVMDYALVRSSGLVDLIEIEASTRQLYTKAGNPTAALVHAEQQVLDWLSVIGAHAPYFERSLPGVQQPMGFVVIGRGHTLTEAAKSKLHQRNHLYRGTLEILTYDDLLDRARAMLSTFEGLAE
jgi:hypothetical protein